MNLKNLCEKFVARDNVKFDQLTHTSVEFQYGG